MQTPVGVGVGVGGGSGGGSGGWEWGEQATRGPQLYQHQCLCYFAVVTVNKIELN